MPPEATDFHARFTSGLYTSATGIATTLLTLDSVQTGTILLGFAGGALALAGGWHAYFAKRAERKLREAELEMLKLEISERVTKLHEHTTSVRD